MNTKLFTAGLLSIAIVALSQGASAHTNTPNIDKREANQQSRIQQGVASGQLTKRELNRLENGQARVQSAEAIAKADGKVSKKERARLQRMEDKQSARIFNEKHDAQKSVAPATK